MFKVIDLTAEGKLETSQDPGQAIAIGISIVAVPAGLPWWFGRGGRLRGGR